MTVLQKQESKNTDFAGCIENNVNVSSKKIENTGLETVTNMSRTLAGTKY